MDHIAADAIDDVTFVTGDIHTFFAGDVTRTGRQTVRGEDRIDPVNGPSRATEFVGGAITSPGIVDRAASTETERVAAAAPADAAVLANNPHLAYANQAYKGYCILEAGRRPARRPLPGGPRAARPRLRGLHPAPLPRGLRAARGHRPGRSAAGVSPAAQRSSASTCASVSPAGGIGGDEQGRARAARRPRHGTTRRGRRRSTPAAARPRGPRSRRASSAGFRLLARGT